MFTKNRKPLFRHKKDEKNTSHVREKQNDSSRKKILPTEKIAKQFEKLRRTQGQQREKLFL